PISRRFPYTTLFRSDEPLIAQGVSDLIARFDLAIEVLPPVLDSEEALLLCQKTAIDIIVTDINMPGLNGLDFIEALQETNQMTQDRKSTRLNSSHVS